MTNLINPQELTSRIGLIAAGWARYEYRVNEIIWHLANVDITAGACITAQILSPSTRFKALTALVTLRCGSGELIKDLNKFSVRADALARQRNRMVHDPWLSTGEKTMRVEVTADRQLVFRMHKASLGEMDELATDIANLIDDLEILYERLKAELPSWPDKQYEGSLGKDPTVELLGLNIDQ